MSDCDTHSRLLSMEEAQQLLTDDARPPGVSESIAVQDALYRVLAKPVLSSIDVPPLDNSSMDGYAVNSTDTTAVNTMTVSQRIPAGSFGESLQPGTVARIFTGAPLPEGADAVVMQEDVDVTDNGIQFPGPVKCGQHVRYRGEDIQAGSTVLASGKYLRAQELGLAASVGSQALDVYKKIRVAMLVTGDELVEPGSELAPGQIYDSNRYTLIGLLQQMHCEIVASPIVRDDLEQTREALSRAAGSADLIISSGGVSVGEEDHVRVALEELGDLQMWNVAIKPGKPLTYGHVAGVPFIGLPGNPVSVYATFCMMVAPYIKIMQGRSLEPVPPIKVKADFAWPIAGRRREYARARLEDEQGEPRVSIYPNQSSGVLSSTSWANGFVEIPENTTVEKGDDVNFRYFEMLL